MKTPVCLIIFRRPEHTARVLEALAKVRPAKLLVVADGPRPDHPGDIEACAATKELIERISWDCEVVTNYSDVNLGCGERVATGIDWVFEQVEEAIILEDDCVPHPSFFRFCDEMLEKYRHDTRVMHINGSTYRRGPMPIPDSYYFSRGIGCWGWATWRRSWDHFDLHVKSWSSVRNTRFLRDVIDNDQFVSEYQAALDTAYESGGMVSWDHQWAFACWVNSGLAICPRHNLVSNEGCGPEATHTFDASSPEANLPTNEMPFPLSHPELFIHNREMDLQNWNASDSGAKPAKPHRNLYHKAASVASEFLRKFLRLHRSSEPLRH